MYSPKLQTPSTEGARVHPTYLFWGGAIPGGAHVLLLDLHSGITLGEFRALSGVLGIEF